MKVSVIIPFNKGIAFLTDCFESLLNQSFRDFDTILVCDHVEDDINDLVNEYKEGLNLFVYTLDEKTGVAAARNLGLEKANGDYVYFLDSDDYLLEDSLEILVEATKERDAEVVYGKKKSTWFKRSVFLATNTQDENDDDDDDDENTYENTQLNLENGGEEESASSVDDNQLMDDESKGTEEDLEGDNHILTPEEEAEALQRSIESRKNKAHSILLSKRNGMVNVSILHILIKRSLIEENQIRFNEEFKYFSDFSFVVQILSVANIYEKRMASKYIKRKHNDPINLPALTQIKDSNRFYEYIDSYYYTKDLIPADSELRDRVDKKILVYYSKLFAPRLRRSTNDAWRTERFNIMNKIVSDMNPELIKKQKGYRKRLINALLKGDVEKSIRIVNFHLGWKKFKKLRKSKRARMKYLYTRWFLKKPMIENMVLFESFFGKNYSDSPKYIYEYLAKNYPGKYEFVWVIDKEDTKIPYKHKKVKRFSIRYAYYLARSKYYVFNSRQPEWVKKREGNVFLQTWHGTPLKRLVFDQEDVSSATPRYKAQVYKQSRAWDYLIAANYFSSEVFKRCFMFNKVMLETGYPRNDMQKIEMKSQQG